MEPETLAGLQILAASLASIVGASATLVGCVESSERRVLRWSIPVLLLSWLIVPWLVYGLVVVGRWNMNQINWIERPPVVEPADQERIKAKHGVEK